jgi:hypothetical protein
MIWSRYLTRLIKIRLCHKDALEVWPSGRIRNSRRETQCVLVNNNIMYTYVQLTVCKRKIDWDTCFVFEMSLVQILAHRLITLTEGFHGFPQSLQTVCFTAQIKFLRKYKSKKINVILPWQCSCSLMDLLVVSLLLQSMDVRCSYSLLWTMIP